MTMNLKKRIASDLREHFATLSDAELEALDNGLSIYYCDGTVVIVAGDPHDRARNGSEVYQRSDGWSCEVCEGGGEFELTAGQTRAWLNDEAEFWAEGLAQHIAQDQE